MEKLNTMDNTRRNFLRIAALSAALPISGFSLLGCPSTQSWIETAENDIPALTSIVDTTLSIVAVATGNGAITPEIIALVNIGFKGVAASLQVADTILQDYKLNPNATNLEKIRIAVKDISDQANKILQIVVPDPNLTEVISAAVASVLSVVSSILLVIPSNVAATPRSWKFGNTGAAKTLPKASDLKTNFNSVLKQHGYATHLVR